MKNVTLYYFDLKGRAEPIRLLLTYCDVEFKDHRVSKEDWVALKPTMPFGTMPILEVDGKKYAQSEAIGRYLGHKYNIAGKDVEENFEIDQIVGFLNDIKTKSLSVFVETDEAKKKEKHAALMKDFYPIALEKLNDVIVKNNGHLALGRLTWADFFLAGMIDGLKILLQMPDIEEKYPGIKKLVEIFFSNPKLKAYNEKAT